MNSASHVSPSSRWLRRFLPRKENARFRLVLFPHAGGSASSFHHWQKELGPDTDFCVASLPGRDMRFSEPLPESFSEVAGGIARAILESPQIPTILLGHSFGALLAHAVAQSLEEAGARLVALLVSSRLAPDSGRRRPIHQLSDDHLWDEIVSMDGFPAEMRELKEARDLFVPIIRADLTMNEQYSQTTGSRLASSIVALGGMDDAHVRPSDLDRWKLFTATHFERHLYPGGHFYIHKRYVEILQKISAIFGRFDQSASMLAG